MSVLNVGAKPRPLNKGVSSIILPIFATVVLLPMISLAMGQSTRAHTPNEIDRFPDKNRTDQINGKGVSTERIEAVNIIRKRQLEQATAKLLKEVAELQAEANQPGHYTVSLDCIRKVGEIEKLARSVKDKMRLNATID